MVDPASIVTIVLCIGLIIERVLKHFKKSSCCGSSVEFNSDASVPDITAILKK
jgi:hypothetical protein